MTIHPTNLRAKPGIESLALEWDVSSTKGLGGFILHYRRKGATGWHDVQLPKTARAYLIVGLAQIPYEVQLRALTGAGEQTIQAEPLPKAPEEPPKEEPSSMIVACDVGRWPVYAMEDLAKNGIKYFRCDTTAHIAEAQAKGCEPATVIFGTGGSIGGINATKYAQEVLKAVEQFKLTAVEVLNEPGGSWFWSDPTNYTAYVGLLKATHEALKGKAKVLASWDGGKAEPNAVASFGAKVRQAGGLPYCDGVTVHPYGGGKGECGGANGDRQKIEDAHKDSGLPVWITELGWPTAPQSGQGDSQGWSEAQQAQNITNFGKWARTQPYIACYVSFCYQDYGSAAFYGIVHADVSHKPSFSALASV